METLTALLAQQPARMSTGAAQNASRKVAASRATEDPDGNAWTRAHPFAGRYALKLPSFSE